MHDDAAATKSYGKEAFGDDRNGRDEGDEPTAQKTTAVA